MRLAPLSLLVLALALGACGARRPLGLGAPGAVAVDAGRLRADLRRLLQPVAAADTAGAEARAGYAGRRMLQAGLTPVLDESFFYAVFPATGAADVLGYVPGRHPGYHADLVVVAASQDQLGGAAVLEAARLAAARAAYTQVPARSVLFAVWSPPGGTADGLGRWFASPTWGLDRVRAVVLAAPDDGTAQTLRAVVGGDLPPHTALEVVVPEQPPSRGAQTGAAQRAEQAQRVVSLAERLDRAVLRAAAPPDTTALPPDAPLPTAAF